MVIIYIFVENLIAVIDSGSGGVNILKECKRLMPNHNFLYYADTLNAPFGNKKTKELFIIAENMVSEIIKDYNKIDRIVKAKIKER